MSRLARLLAVAAGGGTYAGTPVIPEPPSSPGSPITITDDSKYNTWPVICRIATGSLLLVYTKADSHHADNTGKAVGRISANEGSTWGAEFDIYDHATKFAAAMGVSVTATDRIIVTLWRDTWNSSPTGEAGIVYSDDDGATWSAWVATSAFTQDQYGAGPAITTGDGDLLVTIEGTDSGSIANRSSHTLRSTDDGATWGSEVTVRDYATDTRPYYESKLLRLDNDDILCIHRNAANAGTDHHISLSEDGGLTWGTPYTAFDGYGAPSTIQYSTGGLIAVTRRDSDAACVAYTSTNRGLTWGSAIVLDDTMFEMEYGCPVELLDGTILVVYGHQPTSSTTNSDIMSVILS